MKMLGALMCVVLVFTAGCSEDKKVEKPKATTTTMAPTTTIDPERLAALLDATAAMDELAVKLKSPPKLLRASVATDNISVNVIQPKNPKNVDSYTYARRSPKTTAEKAAIATGRGKPLPFEWSPPRPIKLKVREIERLPLLSFSPNDVAWARIPVLAKEALKLLEEIEEPRVGAAGVVKDTDGVQLYIQIAVDGTRGSGSLRADGRGNVISAGRR